MFSDRFVEGISGISRILEVVVTITKWLVSFRMMLKSVYRKVVKLTKQHIYIYICKNGVEETTTPGYRQLMPVC